jgi:hypothetical protein
MHIFSFFFYEDHLIIAQGHHHTNTSPKLSFHAAKLITNKNLSAEVSEGYSVQTKTKPGILYLTTET